MFQNLKKIFSTLSRVIAYIFLVILAGVIWWYFTDISIMFGNYAKLHTYTDILLSIIIIFCFPLFLTGFWYRSMILGKKSINTKNGTGIISGSIGVIISGASCCGATLATYVGLLPIMTLLPYDGLEIKILGTFGLLYALYDLLKNLEVCQIKQKNLNRK